MAQLAEDATIFKLDNIDQGRVNACGGEPGPCVREVERDAMSEAGRRQDRRDRPSHAQTTRWCTR